MFNRDNFNFRYILRGLGAVIVGLGFTLPVHAYDIIIKDAIVFDGTGATAFKADIRIEGRRIAEIGKNITPSPDTEVIDAAGRAVMPGLIDVHTHWTPDGTPATTPQIAASYLLNGVTTVNNFHSAPEAYLPRRDRLKSLTSPHVNFAARFSTPNGHGADWADINMTRWVLTPAAAKFAVGQVAAYHPDVIKVFTDGWRYGSKILNSSMNEDALAEIVREARKFGMPVLTHTVTVDRAKEAARAGVSAIAHSVMDRKTDQELIDLMKINKISYAPTFAIYEKTPAKRARLNANRLAYALKLWDNSIYNFQQFKKAGVNIALGTDAGIDGLAHGEATLHELELMVQAGLSPADALIAGTAGSAIALQQVKDRGTIKVGKRADLVLVAGKPWQKITDIRGKKTVILDGKIVVKQGALVREQLETPLAATKAVKMLHDFERSDGRTNLDTLHIDVMDGGLERSNAISQIVNRPEGGHALLLAAQMSHNKNAMSAIRIPLNRGGVIPVDATAFTGIRFDIRGDGAYDLKLATEQGAWQKEIAANAGWRTVKIAFSDLLPASDKLSWNGRNLLAIEFGGKRVNGSKLWMEIDNVQFY